MISEGSFKSSFNKSLLLLKKMELFKSKGVKNMGEYSSEYLKICRTNKHTSIHKTALDNLDYEVILKDDSIFQISKDSDSLRFCFIQNPNFNFSKNDFVKYLYSEDGLLEIDDDTLSCFISEIDENEYEQFLNEQELNLHSTIIRYDYDKKGYKPLLHSCSHIHIGLNENLRIPCSIILTPLKFVVFCLKQIYYDKWSVEFNKNTNSVIYLKEVKNECKKIKGNWVKIEENQIYIT